MRYFFDLHGDVTVPDREGQELSGLAAVQARARKEARQLIAANVIEQGKIDLFHRIDVRDESGTIVHSLEFGVAVKVQRSGIDV